MGAAVASEFKAWLLLYRSVRVAEILEGKIPELKGDASFRHAVVLAVGAHLANHGVDDGGIVHLGTLLKALTPELRVLFFKSLPVDLVSRLALHPAVRAVASKAVLDYVGR